MSNLISIIVETFSRINEVDASSFFKKKFEPKINKPGQGKKSIIEIEHSNEELLDFLSKEGLESVSDIEKETNKALSQLALVFLKDLSEDMKFKGYNFLSTLSDKDIRIYADKLAKTKSFKESVISALKKNPSSEIEMQRMADEMDLQGV